MASGSRLGFRVDEFLSGHEDRTPYPKTRVML